MPWFTSHDVDEFAAAAGGYLRARPVHNTILLSVTEDLRARRPPTLGSDAPVFGWWTSADGSVAAAFVQTPPRPVVLSQVPPEARESLVDMIAAAPGINAELDLAEDIVGRRGGTPRVHMRTRLFRLADLLPPDPAPPGEARLAGPDDRELVLHWFEAFGDEVGERGVDVAGMVDDRIGFGGVTLWVVDGAPVSLAGRTRPSSGVIRLGPVYTPVELRRRGYAAAVTTAASRAAQRLAGEVVLFTDLANPTSNAIYQRLGYRPLCDRVVLVFDAPAD